MFPGREQYMQRICKQHQMEMGHVVFKKSGELKNSHWRQGKGQLLGPSGWSDFAPELFFCFLDVIFLNNVFRATRSKTTSLPAALNQARRIDTLDVFYLYETFKLVLFGCHTMTTTDNLSF
jgi:hypothetical protein